jgi:hypothetical protein
MKLPAVIYVSDFRRLTGLDWTDKRLRRYMHRNGIALLEAGRRRLVYTTPSVLREKMPDVFQAIWLRLEAEAHGVSLTREQIRALLESVDA